MCKHSHPDTHCSSYKKDRIVCAFEELRRDLAALLMSGFEDYDPFQAGYLTGSHGLQKCSAEAYAGRNDA